MTETTDPIRLSFELRCLPAHAFTTWTARTSLWWPTEHTASTEPGVAVIVEPRVGGRIYERTPSGAEHEWGEILAWDPPARLVYRWHLNQDLADASEVEIAFTPAPGNRTRVEIEHRGWERLGRRGPVLRRRNVGGWNAVLPFFVEAAEAGGAG